MNSAMDNISAWNNTQCEESDECSKCGVVLAVLYLLSGLICMLGNALVLAVIYRTRQLHRISNYFIASLAAADFSVGLLVSPLWAARGVLQVWDNHHPLTLLCAYMSMQTATTTTFNLCAVSIDRFIAITKPFEYERILSLRRCKITIVFIWVSSFVLPIPRPLVTDPVVLPKVWMVGSTLVVILPILVICFCYFHIARIARQQAKRIKCMEDSGREAHRVSATRRSNTKAAWTVAIIIGLFVVTWSPSLIVSTKQAAAEDVCHRETLTRIWYITVLIAFSSSAANPFIYTGRSREYRNAFKTMFNLKDSRIFNQRHECSYTWTTKRKDLQDSESCIDK